MNLMLVVFCVVLIGFVLLNRKMSESLNNSQAQTEQPTHVNND